MKRWLFGLIGVFMTVSAAAEEPSKSTPLVIYTATGATTAQAPLWGAMADGWAKERHVDIRLWKDLDDLRGTILAGQGDVWVGHLDGFAQAARRGAPVVLVAVTAWSEKFRFLTLDPEVADPKALLSHLKERDDALAVIPQGSPGHALMESGWEGRIPKVRLTPLSPQQAGLELARGSLRHMLVPEPLASVLIAKFPALRRVGSLADLTPEIGSAGLPLAGVAVRGGLLKEDPALVAALVKGMQSWAAQHVGDRAAIAAVLPSETRASIGEGILLDSLRYDPLAVMEAQAARDAVKQALAVIDGPYAVPDTFFASSMP